MPHASKSLPGYYLAFAAISILSVCAQMSRPACAQSGKSSDGVSSKVAQKSAPGSGTAASLAQAISFGVPGLVKAELRAGAPVNAVGNGKEGPLLPLWRAVWIGNPAIVQLLVDQGADVGFADENGRTALHIVRLAPEIIAILVAKGADVNARDNDGNTPLHLSEPPITDALLAAGADVNVKNVKGETPIVTILKKQFTAEAVGYEPTCIIGEPALRQLSALVAAKADLSAPDEDGNTALSIGQKIQTSCKHFTETKDPSTMARILKLGPPGPRTATHLVCAVESKDMARVKAELDDGAPVNAVGTGCENLEGVEDWTPLGMAAHLGDLSLVKFLIDHGADAKILAPNNASNGLFKVSVLNFVRKDPEIVKLLIAQGANPNAKGSEYPALSAVAMNTDNDDVQVRIRLVSALLAGGAEVDAKDSAGDTALTSSVQMYSGELCSNLESELPLISALLAAKADPTIVNINGDTARSVAQKQQSECDDPAGKAATAKLINMLNGPIPGK